MGVPRSLPRAVTGLLLVLGAAAAVVASVAVGSVPVAPGRVLSVIGEHLLPESLSSLVLSSATPVEDRIVWEFRLPRALLGAVVGAALAVAGAVLQAVVRNPLADPFVFGVSSGASVAAVAALTLTGGLAGSASGVAAGAAAPPGGAALVSVPLAAFLGALATTLVVYLLAQQRGRTTPARLVLAGVAVSYLLSSVTSYLVLRASGPGQGVSAVLTWLSGSLGTATWSDLGLPAVAVVLATAGLVAVARVLNAFLTGDETAASLGIDVGRARTALFVVTAVLVGVVVAVSGAIGFVGLVVPHAVRSLVGSDHRWVLPLSAVAGALLLVASDIAARLLLAPSELPVGLVTAVVGAPFFLWLLHRSGRTA